MSDEGNNFSDSGLRRAQIVVKRSLVRRRKPTQPDVVAPPTEPTFKASDSDLRSILLFDTSAVPGGVMGFFADPFGTPKPAPPVIIYNVLA